VPVRAQIVTDADGTGAWTEAWDALAVHARRPLCAPAWALAWWRHAAPPGAALRVVLVLEGEQLIGVAPLYLEPGRLRRLRLLAADVSARTEPLSQPGREREVAEAMAAALAPDRPGALLLEGVDDRSPWPAALHAAWRGSRLSRERTGAAPRIVLQGGDVEAWLSGLSSKMRAQLRRHRRRLEDAGAVFSRAQSGDELTRALEAFAHLHRVRWAERGGSGVLDDNVERMLAAAGAGLLGADRFRAYTVEVDGELISIQLFVAAGGEVTYWLGGFDERWSKQSPALLAVVEAVREALEAGETGIDLGYGDQEYKLRLADSGDALSWFTLALPGWRAPLVLGTIAAGRARSQLSERLPDGFKQRLKRVRDQFAASA
jgi:CelD/BcsL family acetyltransferase involved in cellulose biosynthesis